MNTTEVHRYKSARPLLGLKDEGPFFRYPSAVTGRLQMEMQMGGSNDNSVEAETSSLSTTFHSRKYILKDISVLRYNFRRGGRRMERLRAWGLIPRLRDVSEARDLA